MSGGIPSARNFAHVRKNFLSPAAKPSIGSNVPPQSHPGPLLGKLPALCSGGSSDPCFSLFRSLPRHFRASRTGLKTGHYKEDLTARRARHRRFRAAACPWQASRRYEIIIYWSQADEAFIAEVPELPGCAADGKTYKEALANVEIVIQEWIETAKELGRPNPEPRGRVAFA